MSTPPTPPPAAPGRLVALDVLRGFALCGIVWLNVPAATGWRYGPGPVVDLAPWLEPLLRGRFIALFALLFGVGTALALHGAARRSARPRVVLARRMLFLLGLGVLHALLQPGSVLPGYALSGLVLLLPLSFLRRPWVALALAAAALGAVPLLGLEPAQVALGMTLLGFAAARLGLHERLERPGRGAVVAAAVLLPAYAVALRLQETVENPVVGGAQAAYTWADALAALVGAALYGLVVVLAVRTRLRPLLRAVLEPLGRMTLTCYVGATLVAVLARAVSGSATTTSTAPDLLLTAAVLLGQVLACRWWLARFHHGPLEWAWRCATWLRVVPNRRASGSVRRMTPQPAGRS